MSKHYYIEVKLGNRWTLVETKTRHTDALDYVKKTVTVDTRYPIRVVKVVRTVVFEGK